MFADQFYGRGKDCAGAVFPPASSVGRPRKWPRRQIVDAMPYLLRDGLPWRMLSPGFPPSKTMQRYFYQWRDSGLCQTINHYLPMEIRVAEGREASPSAGVIDTQSLNTTESGGPRDYDAGKRIKDRKRLCLVASMLGHGTVTRVADTQLTPRKRFQTHVQRRNHLDFLRLHPAHNPQNYEVLNPADILWIRL